MRFIFAGGAMEVGGSCIYVRIGDKGILFDAGIRQGSGKDPLPDFRAIQLAGGVDAILVSHAHMDHTGSLPVISKAYPNARIYMTPMTERLTRVLLADSLKIMDKREEEIPHYSAEDVAAMLDRVVPVRLEFPCAILEGFSVTCYPAGHIAGAVCMYLETPEGTILYTGDVAMQAQRTIDGLRLPSRLRPDVMIMESTYGDRLHANRQAEEIRLVHILDECIAQGKKILIPAFALGRAQEVLLILRSAMQKKEIPRVPVYVDGMVRDINRVYTMYPTYLRSSLARRIMRGTEPFYSEDVRAVAPLEDRNTLVNQKGPCIFVSSSGMLTGGPSMLYAKTLAPREDACIIITGYQDEEAPGRALMNLLEHPEEASICLDGVTVPVKCRIEQVGLSAHADQSELCSIADRLSPRNLILVHGNQAAMDTLGRELARDVRRRIYEPHTGETVEMLLGVRRSQLPRILEQSMHANNMPEPDSLKTFREKLMQWYPLRSFTPEECYYLWFGKALHASPMPKEEEDALQLFLDRLLDSGCFLRDPRRMYLVRPATDEEMAEAEADIAVTPQDVERVLRSVLPSDSIRKIGYYPDEKRAELTVDFPDAFDPVLFAACTDALQQNTGWTLSVRDRMNYNQAILLLETLFPEGIGKVSYFEQEKAFLIHPLIRDKADAEKIRRFRDTTGWQLWLDTKDTADAPSTGAAPVPSDPDWFIPHAQKAPMEQNAVFQWIDSAFWDIEGKPYKKGLKNDAHGRYYELSFLSPAQGRAQSALLQSLADALGIRVHIAQSVNQNVICTLAQKMCAEAGIALRKNPAYMPKEQTVQVSFDGELPESVQTAFLNRTGVQLLKALR
ncbi:MAG: MBL fold metallo-hydrolase [Clostridia bacterium]|nr:MBL fold metallo-hydrolase [Clostridia bacterium]